MHTFSCSLPHSTHQHAVTQAHASSEQNKIIKYHTSCHQGKSYSPRIFGYKKFCTCTTGPYGNQYKTSSQPAQKTIELAPGPESSTKPTTDQVDTPQLNFIRCRFFSVSHRHLTAQAFLQNNISIHMQCTKSTPPQENYQQCDNCKVREKQLCS